MRFIHLSCVQEYPIQGVEIVQLASGTERAELSCGNLRSVGRSDKPAGTRQPRAANADQSRTPWL